MSTRKLKIGLLGCGTVGRGLVELVNRSSSLIRQRTGAELTITKILVRDLQKERPGVDRSLLTIYPEKVIENGCDMVVELVGGIEPARSFIQQSLACRKHVVTANKALLALDGFGLMKAAETRKVRLGFEASVCGGIPIIRALRDGLVGNNIQSLSGILNGTCNFILTRMTEDRVSFETALREAQAKGFAEADPSLDVDGHDAAQKLKILAELAFHAEISPDTVPVQGIRDITASDIEAAAEFGYVIKHLASVELVNGNVSLRAAPMLLPAAHPLAGVRDENNAVLVRGDAVGEMLFSGKGAGALPSASAVLSDVVDIACHKGGFAMSSEGRVQRHGQDLLRETLLAVHGWKSQCDRLHHYCPRTKRSDRGPRRSSMGEKRVCAPSSSNTHPCESTECDRLGSSGCRPAGDGNRQKHSSERSRIVAMALNRRSESR